MKISLIGYWDANYYEESLKFGLEYNSIQVDKIKLIRKNKFSFYYTKNYLNKIFDEILKKNNKVLFFWQCNEIPSSFFKKLKKHKYIIIQYHNDNIFNFKNFQRLIKFFRVRNRLSFCDLIFYYRKGDLNYLKKYSVNSFILPPFYNEQYHYKKKITKKYDVVFIGHYENDERVDFLNYLYDKKINILVGGPAIGWNKSKLNSNLKNNIQPYFNQNYNEIINQSKLGICFLSKINSDDYTRRCFEIPACGTPILLPKTETLFNIFGDLNHFYSNKQEMYEKILFYLNNEKERLNLLKKQREKIKEFEIKNISKEIKKRLYALKHKIDLKLLIHHPSLQNYRLYLFEQIQNSFKRVDFLFDYKNFENENTLNNSMFLSNKMWMGRKGKFILNFKIIKIPTHDVLIMNDHFNLTGIINFFIYFMFNKKIIIWTEIGRNNYKSKYVLSKIYFRILYALSNKVLCLTKDNQLFIEKKFFTRNIKTMGNTTINFFREFNKEKNKNTFNIKEQLLINKRNLNIVYIGRIEKEKGILNLLKSLTYIKNINFNLLLIGKNLIEIDEIEKFKLNVHVFDEISYKEINKFYLISDLFVFPTLNDTWGLVINEAMSYNTAILCSKKAGCYPDLINESVALCCDPENIRELAEKIEYALKNKEKLIFRKEKDEILDNYSLENQVNFLKNEIETLF